jgi:hypothetical protein
LYEKTRRQRGTRLQLVCPPRTVSRPRCAAAR